MIRALGVFVVVLAATPATAEQENAKRPAPARRGKAKAAPADDAAPIDEVPGDGEGEAEPSPEEIEASLPPHINGPKLVDLAYNIEIDLPEGMVLFERAEARKMLEEGGSDGENVRAI